jgi:hypothetical protein
MDKPTSDKGKAVLKVFESRSFCALRHDQTLLHWNVYEALKAHGINKQQISIESTGEHFFDVFVFVPIPLPPVGQLTDETPLLEMVQARVCTDLKQLPFAITTFKGGGFHEARGYVSNFG